MTHGEEPGSNTHRDSAALTYLEGLLMHRAVGGTGAVATQRSESGQRGRAQLATDPSGAAGQGIAPASQHYKKARLLRCASWCQTDAPGGEQEPGRDRRATSVACSGPAESTLLASLLQTVVTGQSDERSARCYVASCEHHKGLVKKHKLHPHDGPPYCRQPSQQRGVESPCLVFPVSRTEQPKGVTSLARSSPVRSPRPSVACSQLALLLSSEAHLQQYSREQALKARLTSRLAGERLAAMTTQDKQQTQTIPDTLSSLSIRHDGIRRQHQGKTRQPPHPARGKRPFERQGGRQTCSSLLLLLLNGSNPQQHLIRNGHLAQDRTSPVQADRGQCLENSCSKDSSDTDSSSSSPIDLSVRSRGGVLAGCTSSSSRSSSSSSIDQAAEARPGRGRPERAAEAERVSRGGESEHMYSLMQLLLNQKNNQGCDKPPGRHAKYQGKVNSTANAVATTSVVQRDVKQTKKPPCQQEQQAFPSFCHRAGRSGSSPPRSVPTPTHPQPTPTHPQPAPTHPQPSPTHPQPSPTHPQPTPTHPQPTPTHPQPSPTHPQPTPTHPQPSPTHPQPAPTHPQPAPTHPQPTPTHPQPTPTHPQPTPTHPQPAPTHPQPTPTHPQPTPTHPQPAPTHPQPTPTHPQPTPTHPQPGPLDLCKSAHSFSAEQRDSVFSASMLLQNLAQSGTEHTSPTPPLGSRGSQQPSNDRTLQHDRVLIVPSGASLKFESQGHAQQGLYFAGSGIENVLERRTVLQLLLGTSSGKTEKCANDHNRTVHSEKPSDRLLTCGLEAPLMDIAIKTELKEEDDKDESCYACVDEGDFKSEPIGMDGILSQLLKQETNETGTAQQGDGVHSRTRVPPAKVKEERRKHQILTVPKKRKLCVELKSRLNGTPKKHRYTSAEEEHLVCNTAKEMSMTTPDSLPPREHSLSECPSKDSRTFNVLKQLLLSDACLEDRSVLPHGMCQPCQGPPADLWAAPSATQIHKEDSSARTFLRSVCQDSSKSRAATTGARPQGASEKRHGENGSCSPRLTRANPILYYMLQKPGNMDRNWKGQSVFDSKVPDHKLKFTSGWEAGEDEEARQQLSDATDTC